MKQAREDEFSKRQIAQIRMVFNEGFEELVLPEMQDQIGGLRSEMKQRFDAVDKRFENVESRLDNREARLSVIETDVKYLREGHDKLFKQVQRVDDQLAELITEVKAIRKQLSHFITRVEYNDLNERLARVEKQLGLA